MSATGWGLQTIRSNRDRILAAVEVGLSKSGLSTMWRRGPRTDAPCTPCSRPKASYSPLRTGPLIGSPTPSNRCERLLGRASSNGDARMRSTASLGAPT